MKFFRQNIRLADYIDNQYITSVESYRSHRYVMSFRNLSKKVRVYEKQYGVKIYTDSFTTPFTEQFLHFLKEKYNHRANTVRTLYNKLSVVLRAAQKNNYSVNLCFTHVLVKEEDVAAIYLSTDEIYRIYKVKLNKKAGVIRDRFIIGYGTALRYSDYSRILIDNVSQNSIVIKTQKTGVVVRIPLHRYVREILQKYNNCLPPPTSSQNFNKIIKHICRRAGINSIVRVERTVGLNVEQKNYEKWQLVSSHTARRSGATNMYLAGIKTFRIMLLTGHKTEKSFFKYIRISQEENVEFLANHEFFK